MVNPAVLLSRHWNTVGYFGNPYFGTSYKVLSVKVLNYH
jgi:hypothetical protein